MFVFLTSVKSQMTMVSVLRTSVKQINQGVRLLTSPQSVIGEMFWTSLRNGPQFCNERWPMCSVFQKKKDRQLLGP